MKDTIKNIVSVLHDNPKFKIFWMFFESSSI